MSLEQGSGSGYPELLMSLEQGSGSVYELDSVPDLTKVTIKYFRYTKCCKYILDFQLHIDINDAGYLFSIIYMDF